VSRIADLIAERCPRGVAFRHVGTIAEVGTGGSDRKHASADGEYPLYVRSREVMRIADFEFDETAIIIPGEGGIGEIFHYVSGKYGLHQRAYRIHFTTEDVVPKFAYHYFAARFKKYILAKAVNATVTSIRKPMITTFPIPVPPLDVQRELVRILDVFTDLEANLAAELQAELQCRRRQHRHYRNTLFTFPQSVERSPLGDLGEFTRGRRFTKADVVDEGLPSIHYGEIYTRYGVSAERTFSHVRPELASGLRFAKTGDVVLAGVGETVEDVAKAVAWLGEDDVAIHDDCFAYRHSLNPKFVAHYMQTDTFHAQKAKHVARAKVKRISAAGLAKITIPVPSPEEQERIVSTLDAFDALTSNLSAVLPVEISARRKQYEHYRDQMLTFPAAEA
jgi:type I restriction enzyme S subunit